jgi:hypothetical protein
MQTNRRILVQSFLLGDMYMLDNLQSPLRIFLYGSVKMRTRALQYLEHLSVDITCSPCEPQVSRRGDLVSYRTHLRMPS